MENVEPSKAGLSGRSEQPPGSCGISWTSFDTRPTSRKLQQTADRKRPRHALPGLGRWIVRRTVLVPKQPYLGLSE